MVIRIRVIPNAKQSEVVGWEDDPHGGRVLRLRIAAPPVEGKANTAIRVFLAKYYGVPKSRVILLKGEASRIKTFEIPGDSLD